MNKFVLTSQVSIQTRRAQSVDAHFAEAVRRTCEASSQIAACYLLDARQPALPERKNILMRLFRPRGQPGGTALIIALTLDDETAMDSVAVRFQAMLREFPDHAPKTFIMSSGQFVDMYAGAQFYARKTS